MTDRGVLLTGLDGTNPLGLLAALGVLKVLHERSTPIGSPTPRLAWENDGRWRPRLFGLPDIDAVIDTVLEDLETWKSEPALELAYDNQGQLASGDKVKRDLKPKPEALRVFLSGIVEGGGEQRARSLAVVAAYGTETAVDNNGNVKPTAFHFTAGMQAFLSMVRELRDGVTRAHLEEALVGPWRNASTLPSLSWDAAAPRIYALRAKDPSAEKRGSVPGANWLAFVGLQFFPVASVGSQVITPCVTGGWKDSRFRWPLWSAPLTADTVASLLRVGRYAIGNAAEDTSRGIGTVLESAISRSDQGGYGSFSPAVVVL